MENKLSKRAKWLYGLNLMGGNFVYMLTASFTMTYYQTYLGMDAWYVGLILMIARIFDAANDPFIGVIVAKTRTKWGKFRPWIFSGSIISGLLLFGLFAVPEGMQTSQGAMMVWFAVMYILWSTSYGLFDIPIWSVVPALTEQGKERESMATIGRTFASIGCGIVSVLVPIVTPLLGGGDANNYTHWVIGFKWVAAIIFVYFVVSSFIFVLNIKEKPQPVEEKSASVGALFKALLANSQAIVIVIAITAVNIGTGITSNLLQYYFHFDLGGADWNSNYSLITMVIFAAQVLGMMVVYPLIRKFFNRKGIFKCSIIISILGYVILFLMAMLQLNNVYLLFIPSLLMGISTGMLNILTTVYLADSVDFGEYVNGRRDESVVFSMQTFVVKLGSGISAGVAGLVLTVIGLNTTENAWFEGLNSESQLVILRLIMSFVPVIALVIAVVYFNKKFLLDEAKMKEISEKIKK